MKLIHISDLHIGKKIYDYSLINNQAYVLQQIIEYIKLNQIDALLISGDVYDTSVPVVEAVNVFDEFIYALSKLKIHVFIISGNHDSADRLYFASRLISNANIHIRTNINDLTPIVMHDQYGEINVYMLPFIKPSIVNNHFNVECKSYDEMMDKVIGEMNIDTSKRNILLAHQFVTGTEFETVKSDSEIYSLGGMDNVSYQHFTDFDYVALGHVHGPQRIMSENIRYSGSLYKYSISEKNQNKSMVKIDMHQKGDSNIELIKFDLNQDIIELSIALDDIEKLPLSNDYASIILTDKTRRLDALSIVRSRFPYLLELKYQNATSTTNQASKQVIIDSPEVMFEDFFYMQNNQTLNDQQKALISELMEDILCDQ